MISFYVELTSFNAGGLRSLGGRTPKAVMFLILISSKYSEVFASEFYQTHQA